MSKFVYNAFDCSSVGIFFESTIQSSSANHVFSIFTTVQVLISLIKSSVSFSVVSFSLISNVWLIFCSTNAVWNCSTFCIKVISFSFIATNSFAFTSVCLPFLVTLIFHHWLFTLYSLFVFVIRIFVFFSLDTVKSSHTEISTGADSGSIDSIWMKSHSAINNWYQFSSCARENLAGHVSFALVHESISNTISDHFFKITLSQFDILLVFVSFHSCCT